jgi:hypothetical protein
MEFFDVLGFVLRRKNGMLAFVSSFLSGSLNFSSFNLFCGGVGEEIG